jgi:hypothetical protein
MNEDFPRLHNNTFKNFEPGQMVRLDVTDTFDPYNESRQIGLNHRDELMFVLTPPLEKFNWFCKVTTFGNRVFWIHSYLLVEAF